MKNYLLFDDGAGARLARTGVTELRGGGRRVHQEEDGRWTVCGGDGGGVGCVSVCVWGHWRRYGGEGDP